MSDSVLCKKRLQVRETVHCPTTAGPVNELTSDCQASFYKEHFILSNVGFLIVFTLFKPYSILFGAFVQYSLHWKEA